jgi:putative hemolysin
VTETQLVLLIIFAGFFCLNLLTSAARSSLAHASLSRLLGHNGQKESSTQSSITSLSSIYYTRAGLHWLQVLNHVLMAGLALGILLPFVPAEPLTFWVVAAITAGALFIAWLEWVIDGRIAMKADDWASRLIPYAKVLTAPLYPILLLVMRFQPAQKGPDAGLNPVIEDELKNLMDVGQQEGFIERDERKMIYSIFRLSETLAREIMIPRIDILAIDVQSPLTEAVDALLKSGYSRVPVFEETVDNILGVLYTKDLLLVWREGNGASSLRHLLRPAYFVPEAKKVDELLAEMQARRVHLAVVVDEYGGVAGVVSLEDIVEEIVGEIQDEYDQAEELPFQQVDEGEYIFQGRVDLDDFNDIMGSSLPSDEADTIGGFIYNKIGRVPNTGEKLQEDKLLLTVEHVSGRRIRKVRAQRMPIEVEEVKEENNVEK